MANVLKKYDLPIGGENEEERKKKQSMIMWVRIYPNFQQVKRTMQAKAQTMR